MGTELQQKEAEATRAAKEAEANTPVTLIVEITPKRWAIVKDAALDGMPENEEARDETHAGLDTIDAAMKSAEPVRKIQLPDSDAEVQ